MFTLLPLPLALLPSSPFIFLACFPLIARASSRSPLLPTSTSPFLAHKTQLVVSQQKKYMQNVASPPLASPPLALLPLVYLASVPGNRTDPFWIRTTGSIVPNTKQKRKKEGRRTFACEMAIDSTIQTIHEKTTGSIQSTFFFFFPFQSPHPNPNPNVMPFDTPQKRNSNLTRTTSSSSSSPERI